MVVVLLILVLLDVFKHLLHLNCRQLEVGSMEGVFDVFEAKVELLILILPLHVLNHLLTYFLGMQLLGNFSHDVFVYNVSNIFGR